MRATLFFLLLSCLFNRPVHATSRPVPPDSCWQPGFGVPEGSNGEVHAMLWAHGSLYIGGQFTAVGGVAAHNVARWDGHRWHSLGTGTDNGVGGPLFPVDHTHTAYTATVQALAVAPNGEVYVGGRFTRAGRGAATCLARWDGRRWSAVGDFLHLEEPILARREDEAERRWDARQRRYYSPGHQQPYPSRRPRHGIVLALAVAADGTLYAGGTFQYAASAYPADTTASSVACWNGRAWSMPGQGVPGTVHALAAAPDGRVYAGGDLWNGLRADPDVRGRVACWNGTTWTTIGTAYNYWGSEMGQGLPGIVHALAVLPDGTLYAAGEGQSYTYVAGDTANTVARWDGHAWYYCGPGGLDPYATIYALAPTAEGHLYAAGWMKTATDASLRLLRWTGHEWQRLPSPSAPATSAVQALAVSPAGEVFAGGRFTESLRASLVHYLAQWAHQRWDYLPSPGAQGLNGDVRALAVAPDGAVYAGGSFERAGQAAAGGLARWDGRAWQPLPTRCPADTCPSPTVSALAFSTDGQLYAGLPYQARGLPPGGIARWDGHAWHPLGSGLCGGSPTDLPGVTALVADPRGGVYVGGRFNEASGVPALNVARWTGRAWEALDAGLPGWGINALAVAPNGNLYATGYISLRVGYIELLVMRWNGHTWSQLGSFVNGDGNCASMNSGGGINTLAVAPNGDLYVGGVFTDVYAAGTGVPARNLVRWDGRAWHPLTPVSAREAAENCGGTWLYNGVSCLAFAPGGDLYAAGEFEQLGGVAARHVARWDSTRWHALGPGLDGPAQALACVPGGRVVVGGGFNALGSLDVAASHFAVLDPAACVPAAVRPASRRLSPVRRATRRRPTQPR